MKHALYSGDIFRIQSKDSSSNEKQSLHNKQHQSVSAHFILVEKTVEYLTSHLDKDIKLNDLVQVMATNKNSLYRAFKAHFNMTVMSWFCEQRMLHAAKLLENTSKSIIQIADQVGYLYPNHFSFAFKRRFNVTPLRYRNNFHLKGNKS